jgi:hypothetical protein
VEAENTKTTEIMQVWVLMEPVLNLIQGSNNMVRARRELPV